MHKHSNATVTLLIVLVIALSAYILWDLKIHHGKSAPRAIGGELL